MGNNGFSIESDSIIATAEGLEDAALACSSEQAALRMRLVTSADKLRDCEQEIKILRRMLILLGAGKE